MFVYMCNPWGWEEHVGSLLLYYSRALVSLEGGGSFILSASQPTRMYVQMYTDVSGLVVIYLKDISTKCTSCLSILNKLADNNTFLRAKERFWVWL